MESKHALFFLLSLVIASCLISSSLSTHVGKGEHGYVEVDPNNPHVVELGEFAVSEYKKTEASDLIFAEVKQALVRKLGKGANDGKYILEIIALTPGFGEPRPDTYQAIVLDNPSKELRKLVSFNIQL